MGAHPHGWWIVLHLVLFVFWLGGDLGVYYASRFVIKPELSPEARGTAVNVMMGLDLSPKICLVLFLPSGFTLMALEPHGADAWFPLWAVLLVWAFAVGWLALTVVDHRTHGRFPWVRRTDWTIRIALIAGIGAAAAYTLIAAQPFGVDTNPRWLGAKVALYALCIAAGLGIRLKLRPFGPAFAALFTQGSTPEGERTLRGSVEGCLPYVWLIWGSVLVAAVLGVLKPGANL